MRALMFSLFIGIAAVAATSEISAQPLAQGCKRLFLQRLVRRTLDSQAPGSWSPRISTMRMARSSPSLQTP